uniref:Group II intron reverse transcriptase/maturase n=1 Tax=Juglanconis oblonga TaxID=1940568 RepID=A0A291LIL1_9PEZI|nr:group II intron reverse transcriptase/maturase [Juglanconis oblonga]ATI20375.1 group II intron reverse transcriptase/maturase [Juglanconis oblonga]
MAKLIKKFVDKGIVEWKSNVMNEDNLKPLPIVKWVNLPIRDIILRYKMILNGLFNYYSFASNKTDLELIYWILRVSLAKTLAGKLKLGTFRKVYLKFGINLNYTIPGTDKTIDFARPDLVVNTKNFKGDTDFTDHLRVIDWKLRTVNFFNYVCASCGDTENLQVHHLKHIRTIDTKLSSFDQQMAAINRKQIPLCHKCHMDIHAGKYDGKSLRFLNTIKTD